MLGYTESKAVQIVEAFGRSRGKTYQEIHQEGESESLLPILEERPSATYSLQDQIWKAMDVLVNQGTQQAIVKLPGAFTKRIITPLVEDLATSSDATVPHYIERCRKIGNFCKPSQTAKEEIQQRNEQILLAIKKFEIAKAAEPASFKQAKKTPKKGKKEAKKTKAGQVEDEGEDAEDLEPQEESFKTKKAKTDELIKKQKNEPKPKPDDPQGV